MINENMTKSSIFFQSPLFREEQRFSQIWVGVGAGVASIGLLPLWYGVYLQLVEGIPMGDKPASDTILLAISVGVTVLMLGIFLLLLKARLNTTLGMSGIEFRFIPFHRRVHLISWTEVAKAYVRTYRPIVEFGGWGIRFGLKGRAYNVSGKQGLQLVMKNGKKILFGTQKPNEIRSALTQISFE